MLPLLFVGFTHLVAILFNCSDLCVPLSLSSLLAVSLSLPTLLLPVLLTLAFLSSLTLPALSSVSKDEAISIAGYRTIRQVSDNHPVIAS
jgi:hypothetical protein